MSQYPNVDVTSTPSIIYFASIRYVFSLGVQVKNMGGAALKSFQVNARIDSEGDWVTVAQSSSDFLSPPATGLIAFCSNDPTVLATGISTLIGFDRLYTLAEIQIIASSNNPTTVNIIDFKNDYSLISGSRY